MKQKRGHFFLLKDFKVFCEGVFFVCLSKLVLGEGGGGGVCLREGG